ncbi:MAG TPA: radical SAM protein [Deltaproteobacteria bacterium]|nr:radical SAM protein [Deltaproteobacteria bacterium]
MNENRVLFSSVFGPYGVRDEWGEELGMQMELLNNQVTRQQGVHSPRQSYLSFALYLLAENISVQSTVLDFPRWDDFTGELEHGYTHVAISFIVPNVLKVKRMAEHIRLHYPGVKIILGGYGTIIPDLEKIVPHDECCRGEGVRWFRKYFGDDQNAPIVHPVLKNPVYNYIYGMPSKSRGSAIFPGVGCENGCRFCITSHMFKKEHIPLLAGGREVFEVCQRAERKLGARNFMVLDENFLRHDKRARELLDEMTKSIRPYTFVTFSSAENIRRVGADFLVRLGISRIWVGVESKRNLHDKTKGIDLKELFKELRSKGIIVLASTILFHDHHDKDTIREEIDWVIDLDTDLVQFMNYHPWPTTPLYEDLDKEHRLKKVHYRHQHGAAELNFVHPNFQKPADHENYLRHAFRHNYERSGPSIVNMAKTALTGYLQAVKDYEERQAQGSSWNAELLRYEKNAMPVADPYMLERIKVMKNEAMRYFPSLLPALVFGPNARSRMKTLSVMRLYSKAMGRLKGTDILKSLVLTASAFVEFGRILISRVKGHEGIIRQPEVNRVEYPGDRSLKENPLPQGSFLLNAKCRVN